MGGEVVQSRKEDPSSSLSPTLIFKQVRQLNVAVPVKQQLQGAKVNERHQGRAHAHRLPNRYPLEEFQNLICLFRNPFQPFQ